VTKQADNSEELMSRHQIPRHARKRLTIAAIAATALIGSGVTVGVMGIASAGEENQAASEQCVSKDQNGEQQSNLPQSGDQQDDQMDNGQMGDQNGDDQNGGDQNGGDQAQCVGPFPEDFVDINSVEPNVVEPQAAEGASTGVFTEDCGNNENKHQNTDNIVIAPGKVNGAEHLHDYVGNLDTTFESTDDSLAAGQTTCANGDQSTFFWPILRNRSADDGFDAATAKDQNNIGEPVLPAQVADPRHDLFESGSGLSSEGRASMPKVMQVQGWVRASLNVKIEFRGNAQSQVVAMPRFLRLFSGDAKTITNGLGNARPTYTCTGMEDRVTDKYPLCAEGSNVLSIHDYPGCWDGQNVDSENHRDHLAFADENSGACPEGTVAIPQLRVTLAYGDDLNNVAQGFAVDGFNTEEHDPASDHAGAINVMSDDLMQQVVGTINGGMQN